MVVQEVVIVIHGVVSSSYSSSSQSPTVSASATTGMDGSYSLTVTDGNSCSSSSSSTSIIVNANPTASAGSDVTICSGSSTSLGASGGSSYSWSPSTGLNATNVANPTASHTSTTTYTVNATSAANGCTATDDVVVTVQAQPNAGTISGTNNTNIGETTNLSSDGDSGGSWSSSDDNIATVNSSGVVSGVAAGSVTITYTGISNITLYFQCDSYLCRNDK